MEFVIFLQTAAAVGIGNVASFAFGYFMWRVSRHEKAGLDPETLPPWVFLLGIAPIGFLAWAVYWTI